MYKLFAFFTLICFVSCQNNPSTVRIKYLNNAVEFKGLAMTMQYKVIIGKSLNHEEENDVTNLIAETFKEVDFTFNKWNPNSEISKLNALKASENVSLSPSLEKLFNETQMIVSLSDGRFDPTIEPLQRLWKKHLVQGKTPNEQEMIAIAPAIGWDKVHFSNGIFFKDDDKTEIDLGGIAKGLCIDLLVERLNDKGIKDVFVEWGGEIRATGKHPDQRPWSVFISRLGDDNPSHAIDIIELNDQAIATSGDYLQNWPVTITTEDGKESTVTYFHIFDSKTMKPLIASHQSIASVSVMAPTCALADGLATAAMLFASVDEAHAWIESVKETYPDISFWIVTR